MSILRKYIDETKHAWEALTAEERRKYILSSLFMLGNSLLELVAIGTVIPFLGIVASPSLLGRTSWGGWVLRSAPSIHFTTLILLLGAGIVFLFLVKNLVSYLLYSSENRFVFTLATEISRSKTRKYFAGSFPDFQESKGAEMLQKVAYAPVEFAQHIVLGSMTILSEGLVLLLFTAALLIYNPLLFLLIAGTVLPLAAVSWGLSARLLRRTRTTIQSASPVVLGRLSEALMGYQEVKLYAREEFFVRRYLQEQESLNRELGRLNTANMIPIRLSELFAIGGIVLLLLFYSLLEGTVSPAAISLMTIYAAFAYRAVPSTVKILNSLVHFRTYAFTIGEVPPAIDRKDAPSAKAATESTTPFAFTRSIELKDISLTYSGRRETVLDGVSLIIQKGELIGISGGSGNGKTTLARIILQLLEQSSGAVLVDGKELKEEERRRWQSLAAYVAQDPLVLAESIRANVAFGVPEAEIDEGRIQDALKASGLARFVSGLPEGTGTHVGDQGKQLSAGQKQRLVFARALYRDADFYLFDEPTSHLDAGTERLVLDTIGNLRLQGKTILLISQKEEALARCSDLYELSNGRLRRRPHLVHAEQTQRYA